ncbi:hypothetical protein [Rhizobium sp. NPDC090279]|uniref:hypothetical protein n=1 Tax=Rhizobium sp. NPDC090279 TaxID=3364499 RepID=UPI00383BC0A0
MRVHHSTQSYFSTPIRSQQSSDTDDSTPFTLPDDGGGQQDEAPGPSISSSGVPSSISSGLWLSQFGSTSSSTSTDGTDQDSATAADESSSTSSSEQSNQDILDEFAKWANMTPAQKIRAQYLDAHGLTEDSFKSLSADDQKAINDQIADEIKQKLGADNADGDGNKETDSAAAALSMV